MNILFISSEYPPETGFGGIATYTRLMAQALSGRGHRVEVISLSREKAPSESRDGRIAVHRVLPEPFPLPAHPRLYYFRALCYRTVFNSLVRLSFARAVLKKCEALGADSGFDVIEAPECGAEAYYLRPKRARLVIRLHTPWELAAKLDRIDGPRTDVLFTGFLERRAARAAHGVSSPTLALKGILERRWRLKNVVHYPNPLDVENMHPKSGPGDYIIYIGRVEYRKGVHVLIRAYAEARKSGLDMPLLLMGAPFGALKGGRDYGSVIEEMIRELGLSGRVEWVRRGAREEVLRRLSGAAAAVFPSLWENFPYSCLEAMASAVPVIASDTGGFREIIREGDSGLFFTPPDHGELADRLRTLLDDRGLALRLGQGGRRKVEEEYACGKIAEKAEHFYQGLVNG